MPKSQGLSPSKRQVLTQLRAGLKLKLLQEQEGKCPLCGKPGATDLHEAFLKRGDLPMRRQWELRHLLFCSANCSVLHQNCHSRWGQTVPGEMALAYYKLSQGYDLLLLFLEIEAKLPNTWSSPAFNRQERSVSASPLPATSAAGQVSTPDGTDGESVCVTANVTDATSPCG